MQIKTIKRNKCTVCLLSLQKCWAQTDQVSSQNAQERKIFTSHAWLPFTSNLSWSYGSKKTLWFPPKFHGLLQRYKQVLPGSRQADHRKASLASRGFQEGSAEHEQGCGMQEQALPRLGAAGRRQRRAGSARNKRGSSQGKRGPARGTRGWVGGDESRSVLDNYSCISSSSSKMSWRVLEQREEPDTLRKQGSALSRISSGAGVWGWHRKPREAGNSRKPNFVPQEERGLINSTCIRHWAPHTLPGRGAACGLHFSIPSPGDKPCVLQPTAAPVSVPQQHHSTL